MMGCKELLIVDTIVNEEVKYKTNLYTPIIDNKAFDSIPTTLMAN